MADEVEYYRFRCRRQTTAAFEATDDTLLEGEWGVALDGLRECKIGTEGGDTPWRDNLPAIIGRIDLGGVVLADGDHLEWFEDDLVWRPVATAGSTYTDAMARAAVVVDNMTGAVGDTDHAPSRDAVVTYVALQVANLINSAPGALDTLDELAAALGDDANFAATITAALALKAPLASPALTGTPTAPTAAPGTNTTQVATAAFVTAAVAAGGGGGGGGSIVRGTYAGAGTPADGTLRLVSDIPGLEMLRSGGAWYYRYQDRDISPPNFGSWANVNWGTTTETTFGPHYVNVPQKANAYNLRVKTLALPATPFTAEMSILVGPTSEVNGNGMILVGLGWRESSSGKMALAWYDQPSSLFRSIKMTSATVALTVYTSFTITPNIHGLVTLRIRDDGTNRIIYFEQSPGVWIAWHSVARTDYLTPDQLCIAFNIQGSTIPLDRIVVPHFAIS